MVALFYEFHKIDNFLACFLTDTAAVYSFVIISYNNILIPTLPSCFRFVLDKFKFVLDDFT